MHCTRMSYLYKRIVYDDETCVNYMRERGLLPSRPVCNETVVVVGDGAAVATVCGGELQEYTKKDRKRDANGDVVKTVYLRCANGNCQTFHSLQKKNPFYVDDGPDRRDGELGLRKIVELAWYWAAMVPVAQTRLLTGRSRSTVAKWTDACRDVCVARYERRAKMGGVGQTVQIDDCLLWPKKSRGERWDGGQLLQPPPSSRPTSGNGERLTEYGHGYRSNDDENAATNYGTRIRGPWVVVMCWKRPDGESEVRYFVVDKRDGSTLMPLITNEVEPGTTVQTDQWAAYKWLHREGYLHKTVRPQQYFVGPTARAHTVDGLWRTLKKRYKIKTRTDPNQLGRLLIEEWWRSVHRVGDKPTFQRFWEDVNTVYSNL